MTVLLKSEVTREVQAFTMDTGKRPLIVTIKHDVVELRAKGLSRVVVFNLRALYEQGIKEGRVR
jgi:hypothetical protein